MQLKPVLKVSPVVRPPLDPGFVPAALFNRACRAIAESSRRSVRLQVALERENGLVCRHDLSLPSPGSGHDDDTRLRVERHVKFLLWAEGGWRLTLSGPDAICAFIREAFMPGRLRSFDAGMMATVYGQPFEVRVVEPDEVPEGRRGQSAIGGHWDGCRIGIDLGASDYKVAAVIDGKAVFSEERPWNPAVEKDPGYHYGHIVAGLKAAAAHLPRVDAIGGSSAGIWVGNQVKAATLFKAVSPEAFAREVSPMFLKIREEWQAPVEVANDGDVSALAGSISLGKNAILGIAMGSSEAAGYIDRRGCISGQLSELAFAPVDFNRNAAREAWSADFGVGALYFSQQAVSRLALAAGIAFPEGMPLPERLKTVQSSAAAGDPAAMAVFATIGVYFGYAVAHYAEYYDIENVLLLGRVTSGCGGELILAKAREAMEREFPELHAGITLHLPDEKFRRVGQAVAAASLPEVRRDSSG